MFERNKKIIGAVFVVLLIAFFVISFFGKNNPVEPKKEVGPVLGSEVRTSYDSIGTVSAQANLSTSYTDNSHVIFTGYLENLHLDLAYTPNSTNAYTQIKVEVSNDEGTTYFPFVTKSVGSQEILAYTEDSAGAVGLPIVFPGDKTTATGTIYYGSIDFDAVGDHIKISAREANKTATGTLYIRSTVTSKQ